MVKLLCKEKVQDGKTGQWYEAGKEYPFDEGRANEVLEVTNRQGVFYFEKSKEPDIIVDTKNNENGDTININHKKDKKNK